MKKRIGIFETNSSSSHSIVVSLKEKIDFEPVKTTEDLIHIHQGEFGWGQDTLHSWVEKCSYAYTYASNYGRNKDLVLLKKVVEDFTEKKVVFHENDGYIDHQSIEIAEEMFENYDTLKKVLFGVGSYIIISNDNM